MKSTNENQNKISSQLGYIIQRDCIEDLKSRPDKSIDCIFSDIPYGIEYDGQHPHGINVSNANHEERENYVDIFDPDWFLNLWKESNRVANQVVFGTGWYNFNWWVKNTDPIGYMIVTYKNGQNSSKVSKYQASAPYICWGEGFKKHKFYRNIYNFDWLVDVTIIEDYIKNGFLRDKDYCYQHPSPKNSESWSQMIADLEVTSIHDPCAGSGPIAEVGEILGISYSGTDIKDYSKDWEYRMNRGKKTRQRLNNQKLTSFFVK